MKRTDCWYHNYHYCLSSMVVQLRVKTVVGEWCFNYLSSSHLQSQVKSLSDGKWFEPRNISCLSSVIIRVREFSHIYSQLPLRRTRLGPAPTVCLGEVSALEGDEVNDWNMTGTSSDCLPWRGVRLEGRWSKWSMAGTNSTCPLWRGMHFNEVSIKRELIVPHYHHFIIIERHSELQRFI